MEYNKNSPPSVTFTAFLLGPDSLTSSQNIMPKTYSIANYQDYSRGRALALQNKVGITGIGTMCLKKT